VIPKSFGRPHFVIVGTIEARKNHQLLLDIWRRMAASEPDPPILVVIGQRGWEAEETIAMLDDPAMFGGSVVELGRCSDDELASIIAGARALLMPSFAEGFGLPVIEALELGTPVIASDLPVFREIAGDIPTYVDPSDRRAWRTAIGSFVEDGPERQRQLDRIPGYCAPDWATHFRIVDGWIERLFG
jgi:glycosyltransferase involved in cell wall biosynthesis